MEKQLLPIGIDDFGILRRQGYYLIDKTEWIETFMNNRGAANLYTRPRRFAKTLNMTMLREFLDINGDPRLFDGLKIAENKEFCEKYQNKFPVIFLSLKSVDANDFETAYALLCALIIEAVNKHKYLLESEKLDNDDKNALNSLRKPNMEKDKAMLSLLSLSQILRKHYDKGVVILIDEYDVPLDKAFHHGYYDQMIEIIRGFLGNALKTNPNLFTAALTGALRISKESIFTGLKNLSVDGVTDSRFNECFGFTAADVKKLLHDCELDDYYDDIAKWYDGYRFGGLDVYNPWSVLNHCKALFTSRDAKPKCYWANTSGNDILRHFIDMSSDREKDEIETLIQGESVSKRIDENITYRDLYSSIENVWSLMLLTGYLTVEGIDGKNYLLRLPNNEIRDVFSDIIFAWFNDSVKSRAQDAINLCNALIKGDAKSAEDMLNDFLVDAISYRDVQTTKNHKESFYQGVLLTFLNVGTSWSIYSNTESGDGNPDLLAIARNRKGGLVIEIKYADEYELLDEVCEAALSQLGGKRYMSLFTKERVSEVQAYGIAFHKKFCRVARNPM